VSAPWPLRAKRRGATSILRRLLPAEGGVRRPRRGAAAGRPAGARGDRSGAWSFITCEGKCDRISAVAACLLAGRSVGDRVLCSVGPRLWTGAGANRQVSTRYLFASVEFLGSTWRCQMGVSCSGKDVRPRRGCRGDGSNRRCGLAEVGLPAWSPTLVRGAAWALSSGRAGVSPRARALICARIERQGAAWRQPDGVRDAGGFLDSRFGERVTPRVEPRVARSMR
jgi:hypothetical protein